MATYYVATSGNDSNNGTTTSTPWKTISKVNSMQASFAAGDQILFKRGDTFTGTLVIAKGSSSTAIKYGACGSSLLPRPVFSGFSTFTSGFTDQGGNIYKLPVPAMQSRVNVVLNGGAFAPMGRYPKVNSTNGGYFKYQSISGQTSVTSNEIAGIPSFVGGEIVMRPYHWVFNRGTIESQNSTTVTFSTPSTAAQYPNVANSGMYFQNHINACTAQNDYCFDNVAKVIYIYSQVVPTEIKVSTTQNLVTSDGFSGITFDSIRFEGANERALDFKNGDNITVTNCQFMFNGRFGARIENAANTTVTNSLFDYSVSDALFVRNSSKNTIAITNNTITRTGLWGGQGEVGDIYNQAISIVVASTATIQNNNISDVGYIGIRWEGSNVSIVQNIINRFCIMKDDGGAIYCWNGRTPVPVWSGNNINANLIMNGIGAPLGTVSLENQAQGIYFDINGNGANVNGNTIINMGDAAIQLNSAQRVLVQNNKFYNCRKGIKFYRYLSTNQNGQEPGDNQVTGNQWFSTQAGDVWLAYSDEGISTPTASTLGARIAQFGTINNNILCDQNAVPVSTRYKDSESSAWQFPYDRSLASLRTIAALVDSTSTIRPKIDAYTLVTQGSNLYGNNFSANITGVGSFSSPSIHNIAWSNNGLGVASGSLQINITGSPSLRALVLTYATIGATDVSKAYLVTFRTKGTTENGMLRVGFRQTTSPFTEVGTKQFGAYGTTEKDHTFLFTGIPTMSAASWQIDILGSAGTTNITNIQVKEVTYTAKELGYECMAVANQSFNPSVFVPTASFKDWTTGDAFTSTGLDRCGSIIMYK